MASTAKTLTYSRNHKHNIVGRELEYIMPLGEYKAIVAECPKQINQPDFALDYINSTWGLLGTVTSIVTEDIPIHIVHVLEE